MGLMSTVTPPDRRKSSSPRRRSLHGSTATIVVPLNGSPRATTLPPPSSNSSHPAGTSVKFETTSNTASPGVGGCNGGSGTFRNNSRLASVTYNNTAVYSPMPTLASGKNTYFTVEVKLLNDEQDSLLIDVNATALGRWLFDEVLNRLGGLMESDYFGLRYLDKSKQRQWLDLSKSVYKQLKNVTPRSLNFRIKHYPARPLEELKQEKSRYFLYLQLRRDLHSGRLVGRNNDMHVLAAHILQAEIGNYDKLEDYLGENGSLADLKMFENMTPRVEAKIREMYKTLEGLSVPEAEASFLERASEMETYGIEPVFVQDRKGNHFYVGLSHDGVTAFRGNRKVHVFLWTKIHRISYDGRLFVIQVEWEKRRHTLGFKCQTTEAAEALWKWAVDRQCFFTLNNSAEAKKSKASGRLFKKKQLHSFTGRCQKEMLQMTSSMPNIPQPTVARSRSLLNIAKSVSLSRQTKSHEELIHAGESQDNHQDERNSTHSRSASMDAFTGESVRLAGVSSESAEQLSQGHRESRGPLNYNKLYRSTEIISNTPSLAVTGSNELNTNGNLSPAVSTAGPHASMRRADTIDEVASKTVEDALSHAEIMRLVAHRECPTPDGVEPTEKPNDSFESEKDSSGASKTQKSTPAHSASSSNATQSLKQNKPNAFDEIETDSSSAHDEGPINSVSPHRLDRQQNIETPPQNQSFTTSESMSTQVHCPLPQPPLQPPPSQNSTGKLDTKMTIDRADTLPSDSTPLSSSTSSPKIDRIDSSGPHAMSRQSITVDPPSDFADRSPEKEPLHKDIYFPYLSKVRQLDQESRTSTERLYQPLRFDKPIRDPFAMPSKAITKREGVKLTEEPRESTLKNRSPLLLRHGYTPYRGFGDNSSKSDEAEKDEDTEPSATIVREGCVQPVKEPIIVAEYYVPTNDDDDDDDASERASVKTEAGRYERPQTMAFDWSAASARVDACSSSSPTEILKIPRLPETATVVLSQEIASPRPRDEFFETHRKEVASLVRAYEDYIGEKKEHTNLRSFKLEPKKPINSPVKDELNMPDERSEVLISRGACSKITPKHDSSKMDLTPIQTTLVQVPKALSSERGDRNDPNKGENERNRVGFGHQSALKVSTTTSSEANKVEPSTSSTTPPRTSNQQSSELPEALVQIFWFLLVFLLVHNVLKFIRVGPIMGFFGATGPDAIGYWSAIEVLMDFIFFRLF